MEAVMAYFEKLSRHLRQTTNVAVCWESRARFELSASRKAVRNLTQQVRGTHNLPLVRSFTEHITSTQHSLHALVFLCILGVLVQALTS